MLKDLIEIQNKARYNELGLLKVDLLEIKLAFLKAGNGTQVIPDIVFKAIEKAQKKLNQ